MCCLFALRAPAVTFTSLQHILDSFSIVKLILATVVAHLHVQVFPSAHQLRSCGSWLFAFAVAEMTFPGVCVVVNQGWITNRAKWATPQEPQTLRGPQVLGVAITLL